MTQFKVTVIMLFEGISIDDESAQTQNEEIGERLSQGLMHLPDIQDGYRRE